MRIASKTNVLAILLGVLALYGGPALAADTPASASSPPPPMPSDPKIVATASGSPGATLNSLESKVPDSVKDVIKHLDKTTEDVTLDDLNSARQAVAKIEALIEIEKRLAELEKVRLEREKKTSFAGAIPASALQPPPPSSSMPSSGNFAPPPVMVERSLEISRIMGRNGHYSAVIKMLDGKTRTVQVGDHLPDGGTVLEITATGVDIGRGGDRQSLHIKNVDTVFGNSL